MCPPAFSHVAAVVPAWPPAMNPRLQCPPLAETSPAKVTKESNYMVSLSQGGLTFSPGGVSFSPGGVSFSPSGGNRGSPDAPNLSIHVYILPGK